MAIEPKPVKRAKKVSSSSEPERAREPFRREDPAVFARWHQRLSDQIADVVALAQDATCPLSERRLSRAYARQLLGEAESAIEDLLAMAQPPEEG